MDSYLKFLRTIVEKDNTSAREVAIVEETDPKQGYVLEGKKPDRIQEFYSNFVQGIYKIRFEDFQAAIRMEDFERFSKELKERCKISKKDSKRIFDAFVERSSSPLCFNKMFEDCQSLVNQVRGLNGFKGIFRLGRNLKRSQ